MQPVAHARKVASANGGVAPERPRAQTEESRLKGSERKRRSRAEAARDDAGPPVQPSMDASAAALVEWMAMILSKPILSKTRWMGSDSAHSANAMSRFPAIFAILRTA